MKDLNRIVFYRKRPFSRERSLRGFMHAQSQPFPDMIDLVSALKNKHRLRLAAVSNEGRELTMYRVTTVPAGGVYRFLHSIVLCALPQAR